MAINPLKVNSINLVAGATKPGVSIAYFDRTDLVDFLNSLSSDDVAIFFVEEDLATGKVAKLAIAAANQNGDPDFANYLVSPPLPCPPYCVR